MITQAEHIMVSWSAEIFRDTLLTAEIYTVLFRIVVFSDQLPPR